MKRLSTQLRAFVREEDGAAVAEYGLLLAIVAVGMITILTTFSGQIRDWWGRIQTAVTANPNTGN